MDYKVGDKVKVNLPENECFIWGKDLNGKVFTIIDFEEFIGIKLYHLDDGKGFQYVSIWLEPVDPKSITVYEKEKLFKVGDKVKVNIPEEDFGSWSEPVQGKVFTIVYILHVYGNNVYILNDKVGISYMAEWLDPVQE